MHIVVPCQQLIRTRAIHGTEEAELRTTHHHVSGLVWRPEVLRPHSYERQRNDNQGGQVNRKCDHSVTSQPLIGCPLYTWRSALRILGRADTTLQELPIWQS